MEMVEKDEKARQVNSEVVQEKGKSEALRGLGNKMLVKTRTGTLEVKAGTKTSRIKPIASVEGSGRPLNIS